MTGDAVAVGTAPRQVRASTEAERPDTTLGPRVSRPGVRRMRLPAAVRPPPIRPAQPRFGRLCRRGSVAAVCLNSLSKSCFQQTVRSPIRRPHPAS